MTYGYVNIIFISLCCDATPFVAVVNVINELKYTLYNMFISKALHSNYIILYMASEEIVKS